MISRVENKESNLVNLTSSKKASQLQEPFFNKLLIFKAHSKIIQGLQE